MALLNEFIRRPWDVLTSTLSSAVGKDMPLGKKVDAMVSRADAWNEPNRSRRASIGPAAGMAVLSPTPADYQPHTAAYREPWLPGKRRNSARLLCLHGAAIPGRSPFSGMKDMASLRQPGPPPGFSAAGKDGGDPPAVNTELTNADSTPDSARAGSCEPRLHARFEPTVAGWTSRRLIVMGEGLGRRDGRFRLEQRDPALLLSQRCWRRQMHGGVSGRRCLQPPGIGGLADFARQPVSGSRTPPVYRS